MIKTYEEVDDNIIAELVMLAAVHHTAPCLRWWFYSPARHEHQGLPEVKLWAAMNDDFSWRIVGQKEAVRLAKGHTLVAFASDFI